MVVQFSSFKKLNVTKRLRCVDDKLICARMVGYLVKKIPVKMHEQYITNIDSFNLQIKNNKKVLLNVDNY